MATQSKTPTIVVENPGLGGISDSIYQGVKNSLASIVGFDLHSIPGVMLNNQKMTREPGAPTNDLYKVVPASDGNIYYFGKTNGQVYKNAAGVYTFLGTVAPGAGSVGVLDAIDYNKFLYYFTQNRVGQWDYTGSFGGRNDNFGTFTNGDALYHPVLFLANTGYIFIGDGNVIAQIDNANVFTANGLTTIAKNLRVTSLGGQGSDLLIGASSTSQIARSYVLRWNTWSTVPTTAYPINETGINAFFSSEDEVIISAGLSGNFYALNGAVFDIVKQIPPIFPNTYSPSAQVIVNYPATANKQGIPIFGLSTKLGNVALQGIYSYGRRNLSYPKILNLEFPVSTGNLNNITIWSIAVVGNDIYVSSFDAGTNTNQIDKLDWSNKYSGAYFETLIIKYSRIWLDNFDHFVVNLAQTLPAGTTVTVSYRINGGSYVAWTGAESVSDSIRNSFTADKRLDARTLQIKVATTAVGNTAPIVEDLVILLKG